MGVIATAVKLLIAAGVTGEALVAAVVELENAIPAVDTAADRKRAYDRDYQASRRGNRTIRTTSHDVVIAPSLDKEIPPRPPKEIKPTPDVVAGEAGDQGSDDAEPAKPKPARAVTVGALLSTDWVPERIADGTVAREVADRRGREWYRAALESFKNHWASKSGKDARKRDWQATWRNWIIEQDRRDGGKDGKAGRRGGPEFGIPADGFIAALREAGRAPIADDPPPGHA